MSSLCSKMALEQYLGIDASTTRAARGYVFVPTWVFSVMALRCAMGLVVTQRQQIARAVY
ncbi:hypothetical protein GGR58DRAFT_502036 [Xylaria digitata]|nr:hypothetical protein GGR58DRAFT_502036 [Xylaria digitata]